MAPSQLLLCPAWPRSHLSFTALLKKIILGYLHCVTLLTIHSTNTPQYPLLFWGPSVVYTAVVKLLGNFKVSCVHPFRVCDVPCIHRGIKIAPVLPSSLGAETLKNHTHAHTHGTHAKLRLGSEIREVRVTSGSR